MQQFENRPPRLRKTFSVLVPALLPKDPLPSANALSLWTERGLAHAEPA